MKNRSSIPSDAVLRTLQNCQVIPSDRGRALRSSEKTPCLSPLVDWMFPAASAVHQMATQSSRRPDSDVNRWPQSSPIAYAPTANRKCLRASDLGDFPSDLRIKLRGIQNAIEVCLTSGQNVVGDERLVECVLDHDSTIVGTTSIDFNGLRKASRVAHFRAASGTVAPGAP